MRKSGNSLKLVKKSKPWIEKLDADEPYLVAGEDAGKFGILLGFRLCSDPFLHGSPTGGRLHMDKSHHPYLIDIIIIIITEF